MEAAGSFRTWYFTADSFRTWYFTADSFRTWYFTADSFRTWYFTAGSFRTWYFTAGAFRTRYVTAGSFRTRYVTAGSFRTWYVTAGSFRTRYVTVHFLELQPRRYKSHTPFVYFAQEMAIRKHRRQLVQCYTSILITNSVTNSYTGKQYIRLQIARISRMYSFIKFIAEVMIFQYLFSLLFAFKF
jgi:hypothetical protein